MGNRWFGFAIVGLYLVGFGVSRRDFDRTHSIRRIPERSLEAAGRGQEQTPRAAYGDRARNNC
jgi:hypothetical protein